jgi:two-component system CheB/CheR fusion protein
MKRARVTRATRADDLRACAESELAAREPGASANVRTTQDALRLVHDLEVHQIELQLQNEELLHTRSELESGLRRYTELFDFAPIAYVVLDVAGTIQRANLAASRLLGRPRDELVGSRLPLFVAPAQVDELARLLDLLLADDAESTSKEITDLALVGSRTAVVHLIAARLVGTERCVLASMADVTALRRAESALRAANDRKDDFIAALSHELRNPLAPICSSLSALKLVPLGSEQAHKGMAVIERQVGHLVHIIDDLLDVTRIARGKVRLEPERLDLRALVTRTVEDHQADFERRGVALHGDVGDVPAWVDADATRLVQVIGNLLGNALKFTPRGGRVDVSLRRESRWTAVSVRDTGAGIAPDARDLVFEAFVQGPQTLDRGAGGLGLGLAMVKGLVELHQGTVTVESPGPGMGAEFTVRLPLVLPPAASLPVHEPGPQLGPHRVLVVDDAVDVADSLVWLLALDGHDVRVAYDGRSALALAHEFRPEIVLCDIGLPEMDGYAVARAMRADETLRGAFLVAVSGYGRVEDERRSAEAGFDGHLAKPQSIEALDQLLRERARR